MRVTPLFSQLLCLLALGLIGSRVGVAAPNPSDLDFFRERQDQLLENQRRRLEELKDLPGKSATPEAAVAPVDTRCFLIKIVEFKGADALSITERERLLKPYISQCLGVSQLNALLKAVTDQYVDRGLVTSRAYGPPITCPRRPVKMSLTAAWLRRAIVSTYLPATPWSTRQAASSPGAMCQSRRPKVTWSTSAVSPATKAAVATALNVLILWIALRA